MASSEYPGRYWDPEYQQTHRELHSSSLLQPLKIVLPPDVSQEEFDDAIKELVSALGKDSVFTGKALEDYIDPYEIWETEGKGKVPSAAVWSVNLVILMSSEQANSQLTQPSLRGRNQICPPCGQQIQNPAVDVLKRKEFGVRQRPMRSCILSSSG